MEKLRKAADATTRAYEKAFAELRPGMTERELGSLLLSEMVLQTGEMPGFIMVRSGIEKYGMVNVEPFERAIQPGELIVVDAGANYHYYWSDYMRMASMGEPSAEQRRFFDANLASQKAGVAAVRAGNTMNDVFSACYDVLMEHGMKEHVPGLERVGHGLGLDVHEPPSIAKGSDTVIEPGMVLTVEPIYWDRPDHVIGTSPSRTSCWSTTTAAKSSAPSPRPLYRGLLMNDYAEIADRARRAQAAMAAADCDWLFVSHSTDLLYLIGFTKRPSERLALLLLPREGRATMVVPGFEVQVFQPYASFFDVIGWEETEDRWRRSPGSSAPAPGRPSPSPTNCTRSSP